MKTWQKTIKEKNVLVVATAIASAIAGVIATVALIVNAIKIVRIGHETKNTKDK